MRDIVFVITLILSLAFTSILGFIFISEFNQQDIFEGEPLVNETFTVAETTISSTLDTAFIIIFISLMSGAMIVGHLLPTRPIFFIPFIFLLLFLVVLIAQVSNFYNEWYTNPTIASYVSGEFVYIPLIMNNLPLLTAGLSIVLAIVVYTGVQKGRNV